jgi:hypothetical protein
MASTTTNSAVVGFPGVTVYLSNEEEHRREIARVVNRINRGKFNCTVDVTLNVSTGATVIADSRIGYNSAVSPLMGLSLSASLAIAAGIWFDAPLAGVGATSASVVAHHTSSAAADQKIRFGIFG